MLRVTLLEVLGKGWVEFEVRDERVKGGWRSVGRTIARFDHEPPHNALCAADVLIETVQDLVSELADSLYELPTR